MQYGLGSTGVMSGGGLAGAGMQQEREAVGMMGKAAEEEQQRDIYNQQVRAQNKAGNQQTGAAIGGAAGAAFFGPIGSMAGTALGGVIGGLF